jgi:hypothetical protein
MPALERLQTKSPPSFRSSGLELVLAANRASHTRRRAMRVMVVVMVQSQHGTFKVSDHG